MKIKFLCICENGNNRSVFMAYRLKRHGHEALAAGWRNASPETLIMLCRWADRIVVMQQGFELRIPQQFRNKAVILDVGPDRWGPQWHRELKTIIYAGYDRLHEQGFC